MEQVDIDELKALMRIFENSGLSELDIEEEGRRIRLKKPTQQQAVETVAGAEPPRGRQPADQSDNTQAVSESLTTINAPMVGTFYAEPGPDQPPFVQPGDTVDENQIVCVIEAMKLKNEVCARFPAIIEDVLVQSGEPVEFGQALFAIRPII